MVTERGPIPKREDERRRRNKPAEGDIQLVTAGLGPVVVPEPDEDWEPIAYNWFVGLASSGQNRFYAQSDWDVAVILTEQLSRLLKPRFVGFQDRWNASAGIMEKLPVMNRTPMNGGELSALLKGFTNLMVTEGDRRRLRIELKPEGATLKAVPASVTAIAEARARLSSVGS